MPRMKSAYSPLGGNVYFYLQENQWVRLKNSKPCRMSVEENFFKENRKEVALGGAFKAERQGKRDWLYYLGKYEVMKDQYYALMEPQRVSKKEGQLPISDISWFE